MAKKEFSATEVMAILERMEKNFRVFGETQQEHREQSNATFEMVGKNTEDIDLLKSFARTSSGDIQTIKFEMIAVQKRLHEIQKQLSYKVDRDEYNKMGKKLLGIERKLKIA